jgi:hypothetical protein
MAMNGQGPAATKLLQARATQPGAPSKVKHDYAVVLAMAGNRAGAERVLSDDMPPDEARQLLDSATGTRTKVATGNDAFASAQHDDDVPPDVVQVPEAAPAPPAPSKTPRPMAAALAAPPPMVVRPQAVAEPTSDVPMVQPTNPVAAAVTNQQPLALPIHATSSNPSPVKRVAATVQNDSAVTPEVVAMPPAQRSALGRDANANGGQVALPEAPPAQPVLRPAPLPPAYHPQTTTAGAEAPASGRARTESATASAARVAARSDVGRNSLQARPPASTTMLASAAIAPAPVAPRAPATAGPHAVTARTTDVVTESGRARSDETAPMVQFAAAPSQEAAHSFWQVLVRRFPDALGQREPVVIRFEHDGTVFWRVRAEGFSSMSEAQTLCARMRAGGQACFVPRS